MNVRKLTPEQALEKLMSYCSKQERCEYSIKQRLTLWGITGEKSQTIIKTLKNEGFLKDDRFLDAYIRGKYFYNKWGKVKIKYNLSLRGYSEDVINNAFDSFFATVDYEKMIYEQLTRKNQSLKIEDAYLRKTKLIQFGQSRGYETEISLACVDKIVIESEE